MVIRTRTMTDLNPENLVKLDPEVAKDPMVREICEKLINRSNMGIKKYGNTMADMNKQVIPLLEDCIEEGLDLVVYCYKAKKKIEKAIDEFRRRTNPFEK